MRKLKRSEEKYLSIFIAVSLIIIIAGFGGILTGFVVANQGNSIVFDQIITNTDGNAAIKIYNAISGGAVSGGNTASKDGPLHSDLNSSNFWSNGVDHASLAGLWQGDVNVQVGDINKDYRTKEKIVFEGASVETGLSLISKSGATPSQNYKDIPFVIIGTGDIKYRYEFEETLSSGNYLSNATTTEPIWLTILGNRLRVEGTSSAANKLVTVSGQYCNLEIGQTCTAFGKSIKLSAGSGTSGKFDIDGKESEWIDSMKSYKFKDSGLDIYVEDMHTIGDTRQDFMAELWVSDTKAKKIYSNGDGFIGEDENKPNWKWELGGLNTANPSINVTFAQNWDQPNEVVALGSTLALPGKKATLELERLIRDKFREYTIKYDTADLYLNSGDTTSMVNSVGVFSIVSEGGTDDGISVSGHSTDAVAVYFAGGAYGLGLYYMDASSGSKFVLAKNTSSNSSYQEILLSFGSTSLPVNLASAVVGAAGDYMNVSFEEDRSYAGDGYELMLYVLASGANQITYLGHSSGDSSTTKDWCYASTPYTTGCGGASDLDISAYRENAMTDAGLILVNPYNSAPSDQFTLQVNEDIGDFDVRVKLYGPEAYVAKGVVALKSNVGTESIKSEAEVDKSKPMILVGGPCANELTAKALGLAYPSCGTDSGLKEGEAVIKLVDFGGQKALLVYGWERDDTTKAANKVSEFAGKDILFGGSTSSGNGTQSA